MKKLKVGSFAEVLEIGKGDVLSKYQDQLIGLRIWLACLFPRAGPWVSATGVVVEKSISLNGIDLKKGDHLWFSKVKLKPISRI